MINRSLPAPGGCQSPFPVNPRCVKPVALERSHDDITGAAILAHQRLCSPIQYRMRNGKGQPAALCIRCPDEILAIGLAVFLGTVESLSITHERRELHRCKRIFVVQCLARNKRGFLHFPHGVRTEYLVALTALGERQEACQHRKGHGHQPRSPVPRLDLYPRPCQALAASQSRFHLDPHVCQRPGERELPFPFPRRELHLVRHARIPMGQSFSVASLQVQLPQRRLRCLYPQELFP